MDAGGEKNACLSPLQEATVLKYSRITCESPPVTPSLQHTHTHSSSAVSITVTHTGSTHTDINHCCSLEGKPAVYFPQGDTSSTVSTRHPR